MILVLFAVAALVAFVAYKFLLASPLDKLTQDISPQGKTILVTGAGSGIGKAVCEDLLQRGSKVIACDINLEAMEKAFANNANASIYKMDVTSTDSVQACFEAVKAKLKGERLFGLVNNAGIGLFFPTSGLLEKTQEEWEKIFAVNVFGVFRCAKLFYPLMVNESAKQESGCILNVASQAGWISSPFWGWYSPTKHAVVSYTDCLRREMSWKQNTKDYVRVSSICPGFVNTPIIEFRDPLETTIFATEIMKMKNSMNNRPVAFQNTDVVAKNICDCIFSTKTPAHLHLESKALYRLIWNLCRLLPTSAVDYLLKVVNFKD